MRLEAAGRRIIGAVRRVGRFILAVGALHVLGMLVITAAVGRLARGDGWSWPYSGFWSAVMGGAVGLYMGLFPGTRRSALLGLVGGAAATWASTRLFLALGNDEKTLWCGALMSLWLQPLGVLTGLFTPGRGMLRSGALRGLAAWVICAFVAWGMARMTIHLGGMSLPWTERYRWWIVMGLALAGVLAIFPLFAWNRALRPPVGRRLLAIRQRRFSLRTVVILPLLLTSAGWLWVNRVTWELGEILPGYSAPSLNVHLLREHSLLLTGGGNSWASVWDLKERKCLRTLDFKRATMNGAGLLPGGRRVFTSGFKGVVKVWEIATGKCLGQTVNKSSGTWDVFVSPDGGLIVAEFDDEELGVWRTDTFERVAVLKDVWTMGDRVAFSPDGLKVAAVSTGLGRFRLWDASTWQVIREIDCQGGDVFFVTFSPDGQKLLASMFRRNERQETWVFDPSTGKRSAVVDGYVIGSDRHDHLKSFSPDGTRFLTDTSRFGANAVRAWELETGRHVATVGRTGSNYHAAEWLPDGRRVLVADFWTASVWDTQTGRRLSSTFEPAYWAFHLGEDEIVTGGPGVSKIWRRTRPEPWLGILAMRELWATLVFGVLLAWSLSSDTVRFGRGIKPES